MNQATALAGAAHDDPAVGTETLADILFTLEYDSLYAKHTERYFARGVNFWRDFLPEGVFDELDGRQAGETVVLPKLTGLVYPPRDPQQVLTIPMSRFRGKMPNGTRITLQPGRYYPKGLLSGLTGVFPQNTEPFRCIDVGPSHLTVDMNHPLAALNTELSAEIHGVRVKGAERGGTSIDWFNNLATGPGMQISLGSDETDFFSQHPFARSDESPDDRFYRMPRFVNHIDDRAIDLIGSLYASLLKPGMRVLDLMSSWVSHLPPVLDPLEVIGLGMNRSELSANDRLEQFVVHDINQNPQLPFESRTFDAVICTVSVEYMTRPFDVFTQIARVLKPDGIFVVTFSNRWFPPKVVQIWPELHDFERMGLVLAYFQGTDHFTALHSLSVRGYPRPIYDKYFPELQLSDPVYAVWGRKL